MKNRSAWLALIVGIVGMVFSLSCGKAADITTPTVSPAPSPTPAPIQIVLAIDAVQNGQHGVIAVAAGSTFKINATATQCFQGDAVVPCSGIQGWQYTQSQTGGFDGNCSPLGGLHTNSLAWTCLHDTRGATFEVCAEDSEGKRLGECKQWILEVN